MGKALQDYIKYSKKELETYIQTEGSCVKKVNKDLHISLGPYVLGDFKHALLSRVIKQKVGYYDPQLKGLILDIKNVKVLDTKAALRFDDPRLHINLNADCYVFCPEEGAVLTGVVKHVGSHHVGVIIYRVFNVSLRFSERIKDADIKMDQEVKFRINSYNFENIFPYIDGELLKIDGKAKIESTGVGKNTIIEQPEPSGDSGIEEREGPQELDELLALIKKEPESDVEEMRESPKKTKTKTRKRKSSETLQEPPVKVKSEKAQEEKKKKKARA